MGNFCSLKGDRLHLVTGGAGHSGLWFMRRWAKECPNEPMRAIVRSDAAAAALERLEIPALQIIRGDLDNPADVQRAMDGIDVWFHLAGFPIAAPVIQIAKDRQIKWAILVTTTGRFSKFRMASSQYIASESEIIASGLTYTIIRPTMIYGSQGDRNLWKLIAYLNSHRLFPIFGSGRNLIQPIHAKDVGDSVYQVFVSRERTMNREYNIAGMTAMTYRDFVSTISQALGRKNVLVHFPYWLSYLGAVVANFLKPGFPISVEQVMRMNEDRNFDFSEASKDFGFKPRAFADGIAEEAQDFLRQNS